MYVEVHPGLNNLGVSNPQWALAGRALGSEGIDTPTTLAPCHINLSPNRETPDPNDAEQALFSVSEMGFR